MNPTESHDTMPQTGVEPPYPLPSFVFIDLRVEPEAWVKIESELPEDMTFPLH